MYTGYDFDPADGTSEEEHYGIDFSYDLSALYANEYLVSCTCTLGVVSGVDATPNSHLYGASFVMINPANNTGVVSLAVQKVVGLLPNVTYFIQFIAVTNAGNKLSLWSRIPAASPPNILWRGPCPI